MALSDKGQSQSAVDHYLRAIQISDTAPQVRHNLGEEYLRLGDLELAKAQFLRAVEIDPRFYFSYKDLAVVFQQQGNMEKSKYYLDKYESVRPN